MEIPVCRLKEFKKLAKVLSRDLDMRLGHTHGRLSQAFGYPSFFHLLQQVSIERLLPEARPCVDIWKHQLEVAFNTEFDAGIGGKPLPIWFARISAHRVDRDTSPEVHSAGP